MSHQNTIIPENTLGEQITWLNNLLAVQRKSLRQIKKAGGGYLAQEPFQRDVAMTKACLSSLTKLASMMPQPQPQTTPNKPL